LKRERERLIWYEQIEGEFQQHTLAFGEKNQGHFTLAVEDFTGDGKLDLVIGDYGADSRRKGLALWQQTH
jgi:hypothetical protein